MTMQSVLCAYREWVSLEDEVAETWQGSQLLYSVQQVTQAVVAQVQRQQGRPANKKLF